MLSWSSSQSPGKNIFVVYLEAHAGLQLQTLLIFFRFWFLVIFMCVNTLFSCYLLLIAKRDFPSILLFLFLANVSMYLKFYLAMKYMTGERLTLPTWIFMVLAVVFMLPALYFFGSEVKNSEIGAALSKEINQPCFEGLNYFDNHDIWHFLSRYKKNKEVEN